MIITVRGEFGEWYDKVYVNGYRLFPQESQAVVNHSPDGFAWGYCGSGPSQLALAILLRYYPEDVALDRYVEFRNEYVALWPQGEDFTVSVDLSKVSNYPVMA